ncbi:MAG: SCO family protein [Stellaceae bacterium]
MSYRAVAFALVVSLLSNANHAVAQSAFTQAQLDALTFHQHPGARLPLGATLVDEDGHTVKLGRFFDGRPVVLVLDYLHCRTLCGFVLADLQQALGRVPLTAGRDYQVVAISIDPHDTAADARAAHAKYLRRGSGGQGWHFLTGNNATIQQIADAVGFPYRYDSGANQYAHPAGITVVTPDGTIARYILGLNYVPLDLRLALTEAGRGAISTPTADLLLLCYCYDPATGRYSARINTIMQILGGATVLALAGILVGLSRQRRLR